MKRMLYFFQNRFFFKSLTINLLILIGGLLYLLYSNTKETPLESKKEDNTPEIKRLTDIADALYESNKMESSYLYYEKARKICDPKLNTIDYVYALSCMSDVRNSQGNYIASEALATETLPYLKYITNPRYSSIVYNLLGINYSNTYDYNNAIFYFKKAIALKSSTWRKYKSLNNLATVYMDQGNYKDAEKILLTLATQKRTSKYEEVDKDNYALAIHNLGLCYYNLGDPKKGSKYLQETLKIRLKLPAEYTYALVGLYKHLSYHSQKTNPILAKIYAKKAYILALKINNVSDIINTLALLIKTSEANELKKYTSSYIKIVDSTNFARQKTKNQFSNIRYISEQDKTENLQLKAQKAENELELEREKNRNILSYIIISCITMNCLILYFYLKSKGIKEKNKAIFESETRISKKLSDELTHDVFQTLNFAKNIDLEKEENKEKLLDNLDSIYSRTRTISKENSPVLTNENYSSALKELISSFQSSQTNIILNGFETVSFDKIDRNKKITLYRVLQELFLNMKKHSNATLVGINFKILDKSIIIKYTDNGKGIDLNNMTFKNGLHNVENKILAIKGEVNIESALEKGFKVFIKFPL